MSNSPIATKEDINGTIQELKLYLLARELRSLRRFILFILVQITYFSVTLASVWFMVAQLNAQLLARINELIAHLPK